MNQDPLNPQKTNREGNYTGKAISETKILGYPVHCEYDANTTVKKLNQNTYQIDGDMNLRPQNSSTLCSTYASFHSHVFNMRETHSSKNTPPKNTPSNNPSTSAQNVHHGTSEADITITGIQSIDPKATKAPDFIVNAANNAINKIGTGTLKTSNGRYTETLDAKGNVETMSSTCTVRLPRFLFGVKNPSTHMLMQRVTDTSNAPNPQQGPSTPGNSF